MPSLPLSLAWRYLTFERKDSTIALMIKICFTGIVVGSFSLMLTLIIMHGFEEVIHEKMQGINAQIQISAAGENLDVDKLRPYLEQKFPGEIAGISGSSMRQVIIDKDKKQTLIGLKGIEPTAEIAVTNIGDKIITSRNNESLPTLLSENNLVIGHKLAQSFNISVGDTVNLLVPESGNKNKIVLSKKKALVVGLFDVGLEEYDSGMVFCNLNFIQEMFDDEEGVDTISLKLHASPKISLLRDIMSLFFHTSHEEEMIGRLKTELGGLDVSSWHELYPALVSSLKLEKYVMFFILALISLVASMNMVSLLFIQIQQKRRDIAIFKTMGMSDASIRQIFLAIGLTITLLSATIGLGLAAISGFILERYPFIKLPDVYYVTHLPARMNLEIFIVVFIAIVLLGFLATWIPARRTKGINVPSVLRAE